MALLTALVLGAAAAVGGGLVGWALHPDSSERSAPPATGTSADEAVGQAVEETIVGYIEAYNDADCERLRDHLFATAPLPSGDDCGEWRNHRDVLREMDDNGYIDANGKIPLPHTIEVASAGANDRSTTATIHWQYDTLTESVTLRQEEGKWRLEHPLDAAGYIDLAIRLVEEVEPRYHVWGIRPVTPDAGLRNAEWNFDPVETGGNFAVGFQHGIVAAYDSPAGNADVLVMLYQFDDPADAEDYGQFLATRIATSLGPRRAAPVLENVRECGDDACTTAIDTIVVQAVGSTVVGARVVVDDSDNDPLPVEEARARAAAILRNQVAAIGG